MKKEQLKITDLNGFEIQIKDLDEAIAQIELFKDFQHVPPVPSDMERLAYWQDIHEKLLKLKSGSNDK